MKKTNLLLYITLVFFMGLLNIVRVNAESELGSFTINNVSFKDLYNNHRVATPKTIPWAGSYWAYGRNGIAYDEVAGQYDDSPAARFDEFFNLGNRTYVWENNNHSCEQYKSDDELYESCKAWWGHCNAWAAAAIKEEEPRRKLKATSPSGKTFNLSVADQKAFLTEIWMSSGSLFVGDTHKGVETDEEWIFDRSSKNARKYTRSGNSAYDAFWDVTPRAFFLIFTNYVGIRQTGVVIDRFTGDQVWNQPIVGYRILPIQARHIERPIVQNGRRLYPVLIRFKMYWAEDGVEENEISDTFKIENTTDNEYLVRLGHHYTGRLLKFYLYFDSPVRVSSRGTRVRSAGRIIGTGTWYHQTEEGKSETFDFNETHPDFIWLPTQVYSGGGANPYVTPERVYYIFKDAAQNVDAKVEYIKKQVVLTNLRQTFSMLKHISSDKNRRLYVKSKIEKLLNREGIKAEVEVSSLSWAANKAKFVLNLETKVSNEKLLNVLYECGFKIWIRDAD